MNQPQCQNKPNCVSSFDTRPRFFIPPWEMQSHSDECKKAIKQVLSSLPRTKLITEEKHHLHFTVKSRLFGFTDDLKFFLSPNEKLIYIHSQSRIGYSDLGVNRSRVEKLKINYKKFFAS